MLGYVSSPTDSIPTIMEGTRAYLETLGRNAEEVGGLADILSERIAPVYERYAAELGLGTEAFAGLPTRTEELRA